MAWASSPTQVSCFPSGISSRTMSAWTELTSWYSSTSTASNMPRRTGPAAGSASAAPPHSTTARARPPARTAPPPPPQQQQVVEVDQAVAALVRHIAGEQLAELGGVLGA